MNLDYLYEKFSDKLPMASRYFWDGLFSKYSWGQIYSSDLFTINHRTDYGLGWLNSHLNPRPLVGIKYEECLNPRLPLVGIDYEEIKLKMLK